MKQDGIIEMAKEAGLLPCQGIHTGDLKAFTKLVEEKATAIEREACAKHLDDQNTAMTDKLAAEIRARGQA